MTLIDHLKWRYATKAFDNTKKIDGKQLAFLKESIRLSATSYGLQPFKIMVIDQLEVKSKLKPLSYNQAQITDASHLFLFCNFTKIEDGYIDNYIKLTADAKNVSEDKLVGYGNFMKSTLGKLDKKQLTIWSAKQTYIAMSNLLTACAELKIDACPIEGFKQKQYNEFFNLDQKDLEASVLVAVGFRSDLDKSQFEKKVRLSEHDLFF